MDGLHREVAVTGTGAVAAPALGSEGLWRALLQARSGIAGLDAPLATGLRAPVAARVPAFPPPADPRTTDPFVQFALAAAAEALRRADLTEAVAGPRTAVIMGSGAGGEATRDAAARRLYLHREGRVDPYTIPKAMPSGAASRVAIAHGVTGPVFSISSACASAAHAIGLAFGMVRAGTVDTAIVGGSESCLTFETFKAWEALRVLAPDCCRPFSRGRRGMVLGEGAGVLLLEPVARARARGAAIIAELAGFGMSSDAGDMLRPDVEGPARAMRAALLDARIPTERIDHINAHGSGTRANDAIEARAIAKVFGRRTADIAVTATKAVHGHALGASGALEAIATAHSLREGLVPPIANYLGPDPECDLDLVIGRPRRLAIRAALSNSLAFGGLNAVLVFRALG